MSFYAENKRPFLCGVFIFLSIPVFWDFLFCRMPKTNGRFQKGGSDETHLDSYFGIYIDFLRGFLEPNIRCRRWRVQWRIIYQTRQLINNKWLCIL